MRRASVYTVLILFSIIAGNLWGQEMSDRLIIRLPMPDTTGYVSLEKTLKDRQSTRDFSALSISLKELSQLLWAGQGITRGKMYRTTPSAGALYPLELYIVVRNVSGLEQGLYHYIPKRLRLEQLHSGPIMQEIAAAALGQSVFDKCAAAILITGVVERTYTKYGKRAEQYVLIEVGHAAQNILLQATALGLGAVPLGAFHGDKMKKIFRGNRGYGLMGKPYYIIPIGHK